MKGAQTGNLVYKVNQPAMQKMFSHFSSFLTELSLTDMIGERKYHWFVIDTPPPGTSSLNLAILSMNSHVIL